MKAKVAEIVFGVVLCATALYVWSMIFVFIISWIWGIEPIHLVPGMLPYSEWGVK